MKKLIAVAVALIALVIIIFMMIGCKPTINNFVDEQEETVIVTIPEGEPIITETVPTETPTEE